MGISIGLILVSVGFTADLSMRGLHFFALWAAFLTGINVASFILKVMKAAETGWRPPW